MTPRSIRRAQEHNARKLARKAEKAALQPLAVGAGSSQNAALGVQSTSASARGVQSTSASARGVQSTSASAPGVQSTSASAPGVHGTSASAPGVHGTSASALFGEPSPEIYDEFSPELIAEANAARERVHRRAGLLPPSQPDALPSRTQLDTEPEALATHAVSTAPSLSQPRPSASAGASPAQIAANRANSQLSTGAHTPEGKQTISFNAFRHGLAGRFVILPHESENEFKELHHGLEHEHRPSTPTEHLLVDGMAQHYWLAQRALNLQQLCFGESGACEDDKQLALYLRYQTTHDRGFHKCLNDLLKLRAEKRREQIGFVSQQHKKADQARREASENRKQDRHEWALVMDSAKLDHQNLMNLQLPGGQPFVNKSIQRIIALEKAAA